MARIDVFEMERMQSLHWWEVEYDLSESGVRALTLRELLGDRADEMLDVGLAYPLSEGSDASREAIASWYPGATAANVTMVNGGSEANHLVLWSLLERDDRLAFMVPNYLQGLALGRHLGGGTDTFALVRAERRWALDVDALEQAVTRSTKVVMVCNPNNPTGGVLTEAEMDAVVRAADRVGAWIVADEISPTFWGRYDKVICTAGLSKAFAMPGLRIGWAVAPADTIRDLWLRHDYTTLTPGMLSDRLAAIAMEPTTRDHVLARTRAIVRENLPQLEAWLSTHADLLEYRRPQAGAIAFARWLGPGSTIDVAERIRLEASVLLVPGEMFGFEPGIRFGFGYDIEYTMKGLARVDEVLATISTP